MTTLTASREVFSWRNIVTILRDENGRIKKTYNNRLTQPRKGTPQLTVNGKTFLIDWTNTKKL